MAFEELSLPITGISPEDQPDIMAYSLLRNFVADLNPRSTSPGMDMWTEFRYRATGEVNYARWSNTLEIDGTTHTLGFFAVSGEKPGGKIYGHGALRCSCCLPDYKSFLDLDEEYQQCPAKDLVIRQRAEVYRQSIGGNSLGAFDDESLFRVTVFLVDMVRRNPFAWPPSDRSDRILIEPLATVFDVPAERMLAGAEEMAENNVVQLHGHIHPSISLAA